MEEFKKKGYYPAGGRSSSTSAANITYNNSDSGIDATNVQQAIDVLHSENGKFKLIEEIELEESVSSIERSKTPDDADYNFKKVVLYIDFKNLVSSTGNVNVKINDLQACANLAVASSSNSHNLVMTIHDCSEGLLINQATKSVGFNNSVNTDMYALFTKDIPIVIDKINKITINSALLVAGVNVKIFAIE